MCGRFTIRAPVSVIAAQFAVFETPAFAARFNIAPTQPVPVVRRRTSAETALQGDRELSWLRWGLIPSWAKDPAIGARLINARAETAAEKPAFRSALRRRRCLIVADGFYEWQRSGKGGRHLLCKAPEGPFRQKVPATFSAGRKKQPYFIRLRDDRPFAFAGIWEAWEGADDSTGGERDRRTAGDAKPGAVPHRRLETCTILTTDANELIGRIHDRMPVILSPADYAAWLDPANEDLQRLMPLLAPYPSDAMQAQPVGDFVNSPAHDSPQCIEPVLRKGNASFPGWE
jgi:putative SOS response-associated peptidase YedK